MVLLLVSLHLYIGAVAMMVSLPEIPGSLHTPDEWFSKEQFSANPNWVFFSEEVYNEHDFVWNSREEGFDGLAVPEVGI